MIALYRWFDKNDVLLYAGISNNLPARTKEHAKRQPWWHEVVRNTVEHFETREAAEDAEKQAIISEKPKYNVTHNRVKDTGMPEKPKQYRTSMVTGQSFSTSSLVGSFFHTNGVSDGGQQGIVVAEPSPGIYLIELFSWLVGDSTWQKLVHIETMLDWQFYDSADWMNNEYEYGATRLNWVRGRIRKVYTENPDATFEEIKKQAGVLEEDEALIYQVTKLKPPDKWNLVSGREFLRE